MRRLASDHHACGGRKQQLPIPASSAIWIVLFRSTRISTERKSEIAIAWSEPEKQNERRLIAR